MLLKVKIVSLLYRTLKNLCRGVVGAMFQTEIILRKWLHFCIQRRVMSVRSNFFSSFHILHVFAVGKRLPHWCWFHLCEFSRPTEQIQHRSDVRTPTFSGKRLKRPTLHGSSVLLWQTFFFFNTRCLMKTGIEGHSSHEPLKCMSKELSGWILPSNVDSRVWKQRNN